MGASKHAAIYIRVSSEQQGSGASPDEQERECKALAGALGLEVVEVYRDVKAYRVGKRLVEPSGTRADRPGLVAMLRDASAGRFDVIMAWREDRLYRGLRPMLNVLEVIQEHKIEIVLAKETFDAKLAPLKAWVASMELDAIKERTTMGVKARLRKGKPSGGQSRYGYRAEGDRVVIDDTEAEVVRSIFAWYLAGAPVNEIRRRLIEMGAQQNGLRGRRTVWSRESINGILSSAAHYAAGVKLVSRGGDVFEIPIDPILDADTLAAIQHRRAANRIYPAHHTKHNYLIGGLLCCDCGRHWSSRSMESAGKLYGMYTCSQRNNELRSANCPRTMHSHKADELAWKKFVEAFDQPEIILTGVRLHIAELRRQAESGLETEARLQAQADELATERQLVIAWGRKGIITEDDVSHQLTEIDLRVLHLRRELAECHHTMSVAALNDWEERAREFLADVRAGLEVIRELPPADPAVFELKHNIMGRLVSQVHIDRARSLVVTIRLDVLELAHAVTPSIDFDLSCQERLIAFV